MKNYSFFAISDKGLTRETNEDIFIADDEISLFAIADGMGGRPHGDVAANFVKFELPSIIRSRLKEIANKKNGTIANLIKDCFLYLNKQILHKIETDKSLSGMGASVVAVIIAEDGIATVANVGDSRLYLFRDLHLSKITEDHSIAAILAKQNKGSNDYLQNNNVDNRLTQFIGSENGVYPTVSYLYLDYKDRLLLCSDGLNKAVSDDEIKSILAKHKSSQNATFDLVDKAKKLGASDNITVLVLDWEKESDSTSDSAKTTKKMEGS